MTGPGPSRRPRLADPGRCPWCEAPIAPGAGCTTCGLPLTGDLAARLWHASTQADHWLDERTRLLHALRATRPAPGAPAPPTPRVAPAATVPTQGAPAVAVPAGTGPVPPLAGPAPTHVAARHTPGGPTPDGQQHPPPPWPPVAGPHPPSRAGIGVQALLVGVGALLLSVAAIVFLAFSWDVLGLVGRSAVVAGLTVAVLTGAAWARRTGLGATAEAVGALGAVLVLLDAAAVRGTGLLGEGVPGLLYAALAASVCGVLLTGYGLLTRVRAATVTAAVVLPAAPALAGLHLAYRSTELIDGCLGIGAGLAGAGALTLLRALPALAPLHVERRVLAAGARASWVLGVLLTGIAGTDRRALAVALMAVFAVLALAQALIHRLPATAPGPAAPGAVTTAAASAGPATTGPASTGPAAPDPAGPGWVPWSRSTGLATALTAAVLAGVLLPERWSPLGIPVSLALATLGLGILAGARVPAVLRRIAAGASSGARLLVWPALAPATLIAVTLLAAPLELAAQPWRLRMGDGIGPALGSVSTDVPTAARVCAVLGLLLTAVLLVLHHRSLRQRTAPDGVATGTTAPGGAVPGATAHASAPADTVPGPAASRATRRDGTGLRTAAAVVAALGVLALPWQPEAPLGVAVVGAVAVAAALVAAALMLEALRLQRPDGAPPGAVPTRVVTVVLVAASLSLTAAVLAAWASRWLSVPVTLLAAGALLLARQRRPGAGVLLVPAAALATSVAVGAVGRWAGLGALDGALLAVGAGALTGVAAVTAPRLHARERTALLVAGGVPLFTALVATAGVRLVDPTTFLPPAAEAPRPQLIALAALLCALPPALRPGRVPSAAAGTAAGATPVLGAVLAAAVAVRWGPVPVLDAATLVLLVAAALVTTTSRRRPTALGARRGAVEVGIALTGVVVLVALAVRAARPDPVGPAPALTTDQASPPWVTLLLLAVTAAVLAAGPGRRPVGWAVLLLGTASLWTRLADGDVTLVEAYTLPPALALVAVGLLPLWRGRATGTLPLSGGAALALLPTALAGIGGPWWRPLVVLVVAALLVGVVGATRSTRTTATRVPLLTVAAVAVLVGPWVRALGDATRLPAGTAPEVWSLPVAAVLAVAAAVAVTARLLPDRLVGAAAVPALLAAALPVLPAAARSGPGAEGTVRALALVLLGGVVAVLVPALGRRPLGRPAQATGIAVGAVAVLAGLLFDLPGDLPPETLTVPFALVVLATGVLETARRPDLGSWPWLGTGSVLLLLPGLVAALDSSPPWRVVSLAVAGAALLLAGAGRRWQAPVVVGAVGLVAHGLWQLGPWFVAAYGVLPRWVSLGAVGLLLLVLGAGYERRIRDLRALRTRVGRMR